MTIGNSGEPALLRSIKKLKIKYCRDGIFYKNNPKIAHVGKAVKLNCNKIKSFLPYYILSSLS